MNEKETAKQRMIRAVKELICLGKAPSEITVADITERAGVGNGMVNYHFQSKDNLMREAVRDVTACTNKYLTEKLKPFSGSSAKERLTEILKAVFDFCAQNAEISKIAFLDHLESENGVPHLLGEVQVYQECLSELFEGDQKRIRMEQYMIAGFLNYIFLKADSIEKETKVRFYNKEERDEMVEFFVQSMIGVR